MIPVFLQRFWDHIRSRLQHLLLRSFRPLNMLVAQPTFLPVMEARPQAQRQPRQIAPCQGLSYLILVVSVAFFVAWCTPVPPLLAFTPAALTVVAHIVYLSIYALEHYGVIDGERCDTLIESVEGLCRVRNFFKPEPHTMLWLRRGLAFLRADFVDVDGQEDQDGQEGD